MKGERMKNIEEMSDRELLEELVAAKRRDQIIEYIKWGVIAVFIISIYAMIARYIPQIKAFLDASNTLINDLEATNQQINDVIDAFAYLHGYQYFEDSDHFNLATDAVLTNFGDFKRELRRLGRATLQFSRKPFWYDVESLNRYINVPLIDEIPTKEFQNPFKLIAKPIIEFQTTAGSIGSFQYSITDDDGVETAYSGYLNSSAATTVIDCEKEANIPHYLVCRACRNVHCICGFGICRGTGKGEKF